MRPDSKEVFRPGAPRPQQSVQFQTGASAKIVPEQVTAERRARPNLRGQIITLWDLDSTRRRHVTELVERAVGHRPLLLGEGCADAFAGDAECAIALVGLGQFASNDRDAFDHITQCKCAGQIVLCYAGGVNAWPLRDKCRPLLAGAARLLDSSAVDFSRILARHLEQAWEALRRIRAERAQLNHLMREHGIIGTSFAITEAFRSAMRFSAFSDLPVLITGESGTGKELLARAIGKMDPKRRAGPFIPINCAAVPATLLESEFFGHRRGAFTGADRDRKGWVRSAEGGVLFLDEIGELDIALQAKLLRVIQENRILGLGEERESPVNVRFIAASNRNLAQMVADQKFRGDLFHRLRVLLIHMPRLRERNSDFPLLVQHFVEKCSLAHGAAPARPSWEFVQALQELDWPGNVRQLENLVRQALIYHQTPGTLELTGLPLDALHQLTSQSEPPRHESSEAAPGNVQPAASAVRTAHLIAQVLESHGWNLPKAMREYERQIFEAALQRTGGNQSQAARLLGITPRSVYNKLRKHHLPA